MHVLDAAVLELGEHMQPVLGLERGVAVARDVDLARPDLGEFGDLALRSGLDQLLGELGE